VTFSVLFLGMRMAQYGAHTPKGAPAAGPRPPAATGECGGVAEWRGSWRPRVQQCTTAHPHARVWHLGQRHFACGAGGALLNSRMLLGGVLNPLSTNN
jgi:hypothetical protein